jgi:hypothetical protein
VSAGWCGWAAKLPLTRALQEHGRLVKTRFVLGYLADETERRAIGRQQNKGESLHALHDRLFRGNHGTVRLHTLERQSTQAHCLHLVANAIVYWNTIYIQRALDDLGHDPDGDQLAGLTPTLFEHVNPARHLRLQHRSARRTATPAPRSERGVKFD